MSGRLIVRMLTKDKGEREIADDSNPEFVLGGWKPIDDNHASITRRNEPVVMIAARAPPPAPAAGEPPSRA